jgi:hypothetical protein
MLSLHAVAKKAGRLVTDNSPVILTVFAVTGTVTTAYLTGKATLKAADLVGDRESELSHLTRKEAQEVFGPREKVELVWKLYVPAAVSGLLTILAIVGSNRIGARRAAAVATAFALSERAFEEYRAKVVEKLGEKKEQSVRDEIAQDRVNKNPLGKGEVVMLGEGSVLCYESFTGRYFLCDMETLRKAQNDINAQVISDSCASLTDLYDLIGLERTSQSDDIGWNLDKLLDMRFSAVLTDSGKPCIFVEFRTAPIRYYNRLN